MGNRSDKSSIPGGVMFCYDKSKLAHGVWGPQVAHQQHPAFNASTLPLLMWSCLLDGVECHGAGILPWGVFHVFRFAGVLYFEAC
jgi:hypothetical protein